MKRVISILLIFTMCCALCACSSKSKISEQKGPEQKTQLQIAMDYIADEQYEDAYALLYAIEDRTDEEEQLFACFAFIPTVRNTEDRYDCTTVENYDEYGRCISIKSSTSKSWSNTTYVFDSFDNIVSYEVYHSDGSWEMGNSTFDSEGHIISLKRTESTGSWQTTDYLYNNDGNCILKTWKAFSVVSGYSFLSEMQTSYAYDEKGNVMAEKVMVDQWWEETQYTYNDQGQILTQKSNTSTGGVSRHIREYDSNGYLISELYYWNSLIGWERTYTYDDYGNVLTETENDENGTSVTKYSYTYDQYGNILTSITTYPSGEKDTITTEYKLIYTPIQTALTQ